MVQTCGLFEGLDLLDLWHVYGHIGRAAKVRDVSISKVSRRSHDLLRELSLTTPQQRGGPDQARLMSSKPLQLLRLAYQQWRLDQGWLKVLPTFTTEAALRDPDGSLDVLPDVFLSVDELADHLLQRRLDLVISSSLDLAGELIESARQDPSSPFVVVPLLDDPVMLGVNPEHPLATATAAAADDCRSYPSPAYPKGIANRAATALKTRGLWRFASHRRHFDASDWLLGMSASNGLCYVSGLLLVAVPSSRELMLVPLADPLRQTTAVLMLRELAERAVVQSLIQSIRSGVARAMAMTGYEGTLLT